MRAISCVALFFRSHDLKQYSSKTFATVWFLLVTLDLLSQVQSSSDQEKHVDSFHADLKQPSRLNSQNLRPEAVPKKKHQTNANETDMVVHEREFISPFVKVQMECQRDETLVKVNFTKPFNGILSLGRLETTKCKLDGNGGKYYEVKVNHNATECEAQWDASHSSITNTLYIRFHSSLETGSDIAKNVMCRLAVGDLVVGRRPTKQTMQKSKQNLQVSSLAPDQEVAFWAPSIIIPQV